MADSKRFFCKSLGMELGPMLISDLINMVQLGEVGPDDEVREGDHGPWQPARELEQLAAGIKASGVSAAESPPRASVSRTSASPDRNLDDILNQAPLDDGGLDDLLNQVGGNSGPDKAVNPALSDDDDGLDAIFGTSPSTPEQQASDGFGDILSGAPTDDARAPAKQSEAPSADDAWFCRINGAEYGPITGETLEAWIKENRITVTNEIRRGTDGPWQLAETHPALVGSTPTVAEIEEPAKPSAETKPVASKGLAENTKPVTVTDTKPVKKLPSDQAKDVAASQPQDSPATVETPTTTQQTPAVVETESAAEVAKTPSEPSSPPAEATPTAPAKPLLAPQIQKEKRSFKDLANLDVSELGAILAKPPVIIAIVIIAAAGFFGRSFLQTALLPSASSLHQQITDAASQLRALQNEDASAEKIAEFQGSTLTDLAASVKPLESVANQGSDQLRWNLHNLGNEVLPLLATTQAGPDRKDLWRYFDRELLITQHMLDGLSVDEASSRAYSELTPAGE